MQLVDHQTLLVSEPFLAGVGRPEHMKYGSVLCFDPLSICERLHVERNRARHVIRLSWQRLQAV